MIVDYLTYTFAEEHEGNLPDLAKAIDPGSVALETRTGYTLDCDAVSDASRAVTSAMD